MAVSMTRIAVIFFGLARSLPITLGSIRANIFDCNSQDEFSIFSLASLNLVRTVNNPRTSERDVALSPADVHMLDADLYLLAQQNDGAIAEALAAASTKPDTYGNNWISIQNALHQLASIKRGLRTLAALEESFDYFLFARPDLLYLDEIRFSELIAAFSGAGNIAVPAWHSYGGFNDRLAFCDAAAARHYAERIDLVPGFCGGRSFHPESLLGYALAHGECKVGLMPVRAKRVRANGEIVAEDFAQSRLDLPRNPGRILLMPAVGYAVEAPEREIAAAAGAELRPRRVVVDGLARLSPLTGLAYLTFLERLHKGREKTRYFEIGTQDGMSLRLAAGPAAAVDPAFALDKAAWRAKPGFSLFETTSDDFFAYYDPRDALGGPIDVAFIDGMHLAEFVLRDFVNVERYCAADGVIILHDVLPQNFEMTERERRPGQRRDKALAANWTGDVWRVLPLLARERPDLEIKIFDCPPTGLAVISRLDPQSEKLAGRLDGLVGELAEEEAEEAAFWRFVEGVTVERSESAV